MPTVIIFGQDLANAPFLIEDLSSYTQFDLNLQFQLNERWEIFAKGQNVLNEADYRWSNYRVYGTQIMLGTRYNLIWLLIPCFLLFCVENSSL